MTHLCDVLVVPALSVSSPRLLAQLQSEDLTIKELASLLKLDPGLSARLLHVANSPFFGVSGKISSVSEAVIVLGLNQTRSLIQVEVMRSVLQEYPWNQFSLRDFWHRSLSLAAACQVLAASISYSQSAAFAAGVFHNLGELVMLQQYTQEYSQLLNTGVCGQALASREIERFHIDHGQMGAEVLMSWNFPAEICTALACQYGEDNDTDMALLTHLLRTAHLLAEVDDEQKVLNTCPPASLELLGITDKTLPRLKENIFKKTRQWVDIAGAM